MDSYIYKNKNPSAFEDIVSYRLFGYNYTRISFSNNDYLIITVILLTLITRRISFPFNQSTELLCGNRVVRRAEFIIDCISILVDFRLLGLHDRINS